MACRKAFDVDLVACLLDRDRPEWQAFRDHYPTCPECAAEVRTWTELQAELPPVHPEPERLLSLEDRPASLPPEERHALHEHVRTCVACRDELETLRTTDIPALVRAGTAVAAPLPDAAPPSAQEPARRRARSRFGWVRRLAMRPAFAYGIALALLIPALAPYVDLGERSMLAMREHSPERAQLRQALPRSVRDQPTRGMVVENGMRGAKTKLPIMELRVDSEVVAPPPTESPAPLAESSDVDGTAPVVGASAKPAPLAASGAASTKSTLEADTTTARPERRIRAKQRTPEDDGWIRITLSPGDAHTVTAGGAGFVLAVSVPASAAPAEPAELRVRDASGRRELREQYVGSPDRVVEVRVPGTWLVPGRYTVTLHTGAGAEVNFASLDVLAPAR